MPKSPNVRKSHSYDSIYTNQWKRHKTRPVRRVWIPKPGKDAFRPLGIPVLLERAQQALVKSALEPEWEARFEGNSYGFRPGRSAHDAIVAIWNALRYKAKFVLDADISGCVRRDSHHGIPDMSGRD